MRLIALFALLPLPLLAAPVIITGEVTFTEPDQARRNEICMQALEERIIPQFEGLKEINLETGSVLRLEGDRIALATYPAARFISRFGAGRGTINCLFGGEQVTAITVTFEEGGLAGYRNHPLAGSIKDPAKRRATAVTGAAMP